MSTSTYTPADLPEFDLPEVLHPDVYKELRTLAAQHMFRQPKDQTLRPTVLVHEAWLRLAKPGRKWRDQGHFFASASVTMRHILIDSARRKSRLRNGGGLHHRVSITLQSFAAPDRDDTILLIDE